MTPLGKAALFLASKGLRVFPCDERGKEPAIHDNLRRATTDGNVIAGWWRASNYNIGIATGKGSGIWVLDIDGVDGETTLRRLETEHGALPATVEAITGKGRHLYWRWQDNVEIRNSQVRADIPDIDVRGAGGYVLAPPSIHPTGRAYAWSVDSASTFVAAPAWLVDIVTRKNSGDGETTPAADWHTFADESYDGSHRGQAIARLSGFLLRKYVDPLLVLSLIRHFNTACCKPPLDDCEVTRIVTDIARLELARRKGCHNAKRQHPSDH